jgi:hypothetical protein
VFVEVAVGVGVFDEAGVGVLVEVAVRVGVGVLVVTPAQKPPTRVNPPPLIVPVSDCPIVPLTLYGPPALASVFPPPAITLHVIPSGPPAWACAAKVGTATHARTNSTPASKRRLCASDAACDQRALVTSWNLPYGSTLAS